MQNDVDMLADGEEGSGKAPPEADEEMDLKPPARPDGGENAASASGNSNGGDPFPLVGCPSRNLNLFLRQLATVDPSRLISDVEASGNPRGMERLVSFWEGLGAGLDSIGAGG